MEDIKKIPLLSSEIAGLWNSYESETLSKCVFSYFLNRVDDEETRNILQQTLDKTNQHIPAIIDFYNQGGLPIPIGFTEQDVNVNAPRLFTDSFYLEYLSYIARVGMHNYTLILNHISRPDIVEYFAQRINDSVELYKQALNLRVKKGIFINAPRVEVSKQAQFIEHKDFMIDFFGDKRSLIMKEITYIFSMIFSNIIGRALVTGFGQVSKEKPVSEYMFLGKEYATDKIGELTSLFNDEGIPIPSASDSYVTDCTESPFSEKLMLTLALGLCTQSIAMNGMALADNARADLQALYLKYIALDTKFAHKGANLMIKNRWMEQPPQAIKHEKLVKL